MANVLVIDDEPTVRQLLRRVLERAGHRVAEAANGVEACGLMFPCGAFDLVMIDLIMPRLGGLEVIKMVRAHTPRTRIIAMSGGDRLDCTENGLVQAAEFGADICLPKPFSPGLLLDRLQRLLSLPSL